jgi:DNA-binding LacI/PurR family transcriptional regulator
MRVTLNDIAARLGVSKTTVSIALRNGPRISRELREKVQRTAAEIGYQPDPFLSRLSAYRRAATGGRCHGVIGWLNHWLRRDQLRSYREFEQYWRGARHAAARMGYRLQECFWPRNRSAEEMEQWLVEHHVLGLLITPHPPEVEWEDFDWSRFSLMRFGMSVSQVDCNLVTADHQRAMIMALQKISSYGYERIGLVFNRVHDCALGGNYYGGYAWARQLLKLKCRIPPLDSDDRTPAQNRKRALQAWLRKYKPDAILTTVQQLPGFLFELGYHIPRDVAVASTSTYDIAVDAGINQCSAAIGEIAAEMLIKQISLNERGEPDYPCRILVESRWKDGRSLPPK